MKDTGNSGPVLWKIPYAPPKKADAKKAEPSSGSNRGSRVLEVASGTKPSSVAGDSIKPVDSSAPITLNRGSRVLEVSYANNKAIESKRDEAIKIDGSDTDADAGAGASSSANRDSAIEDIITKAGVSSLFELAATLSEEEMKKIFSIAMAGYHKSQQSNLLYPRSV